jgi:2-dehydro-3-deoxyphosphooctonate aldolase (KDO 8-P synthase)
LVKEVAVEALEALVDNKMILIAGPCVLEDRDVVLKIADKLQAFEDNENIDFYFKASFDKANRTSLDSFRGPGLEDGLTQLLEIKEKFRFKLLTDIHEKSQVEPVSKVVDVLQIPAFLCRQTDLLVEAAKSSCVVNIKKGQFLDPYNMEYSSLKVLKTRGFDSATYKNSKEANLWLTERGSTFGYGNLVVDFRSFPIMREFAPVIFDATHSVQMPGSDGGKSGGKREFIPYLAKSAASAGVDGFFFETHYDTSIAKSDAPNMMEIDELKKLVDKILKIRELN